MRGTEDQFDEVAGKLIVVAAIILALYDLWYWF